MFRHRATGGHNVTIPGRQGNIYLAKQVYRCAQCFGPLVIEDFGLVCQADPTHRFFAHQRDVEAVEKKQAQSVKALQEIYSIVDGKVVVKCQS